MCRGDIIFMICRLLSKVSSGETRGHSQVCAKGLRDLKGNQWASLLFQTISFPSIGVSGSKPTTLEIVKASRVTCRTIFVDYAPCKYKVSLTSAAY
jgi:hypothetical protein